jgi:hypothetical protein
MLKKCINILLTLKLELEGVSLSCILNKNVLNGFINKL